MPEQSLTWSFTHAGGPGGQHVNKTASKVTLTIATSDVMGDSTAVERLRAVLGPELRVTNQTSRSQWRNRQLCLDRAAVLLDAAARPPQGPRRTTKPSRASVERRLESKRKVGETKRTRRFGNIED